MEIKIEKRSDRIEDFNEDKIVRSVTRAGAKLAMAKEIKNCDKRDTPSIAWSSKNLKRNKD